MSPASDSLRFQKILPPRDRIFGGERNPAIGAETDAWARARARPPGAWGPAEQQAGTTGGNRKTG